MIKRKKEGLYELQERVSLTFNMSTWKHTVFMGNCSVLSTYAYIGGQRVTWLLKNWVSSLCVSVCVCVLRSSYIKNAN